MSKTSSILRRKALEQKLLAQAEQLLEEKEIDEQAIEVTADNQAGEPEADPEEYDQVEEMIVNPDDKLTSVSQLKPTDSQISKMSGRTYISML